MKLPPGLAETITETYEEGANWLTDLPDLLASVLAELKLSPAGEPFDSNYHLVLPVEGASGEAMVLKLGVPCEEAESEAEALRLYGGEVAVNLVFADAARGIRLLESLQPGHTLETLDDPWRKDVIMADVMLELLRPCEANPLLIPLEAWLGTLLEADSLATRYEQELVQKAQSAAETLLATTSEDFLLHGDLHAKNILNNQGRWVAIDPKGLIGDRCFEPAQHFLNSHPPSATDRPSFLHRRLSVICQVTGFPANRVVGWALANGVNATLHDEGGFGHAAAPWVEALGQLLPG